MTAGKLQLKDEHTEMKKGRSQSGRNKKQKKKETERDYFKDIGKPGSFR